MLVPIEPSVTAVLVGAVGLGLAGKVPAAHDAGETTTAGLAADVDLLAFGEELVELDLGADLELAQELFRTAELAKDGPGLDAFSNATFWARARCFSLASTMPKIRAT